MNVEDKMKKGIRLGTINCPDWMNKPLSILIKLTWISFVIGLAIAFSPWWLFLLLIMPWTGKTVTKYQKEKAKRLEEWKASLKEETRK